MDIEKKKSLVAWLSVISNTILVGFKVAVGLMIGSVSVISEAIHSGVDLLAAFIALYAVTSAKKPADRDHPFGHGKIENVSGTVEALLIFLAAGWIIYESVHKLVSHQALEDTGWGIAVMLASSVMNLIVSQLLFKVGREADSVALEADAMHLRTDVYTSAGVMIGLMLIWVGKRIFPAADLAWIDPVAAILVALLICRAAYDLVVHAARDLLDASLPADEETWIRKYLETLAPTVRGFHRLRTRKSGAHRFVDFHLIVDSQMTVGESHRIADEIIAAVRRKLQNVSVIVHVEPCTGNCQGVCLEGCLLEEKQRAIIRVASTS